MAKSEADYENLLLALNKTLKLFKSHLDTMSAINRHMGYKMTQPLINTNQELQKILREIRIENSKDLN